MTIDFNKPQVTFPNFALVAWPPTEQIQEWQQKQCQLLECARRSSAALAPVSYLRGVLDDRPDSRMAAKAAADA